MKVKVSEASGIVLDLLVSRADCPTHDGWGWFERDDQGFLFDPLNECRYSPSTEFEDGGPFLEQLLADGWTISQADFGLGVKLFHMRSSLAQVHRGSTLLITAMRCYVSSKLGDEVEIPSELFVL